MKSVALLSLPLVFSSYSSSPLWHGCLSQPNNLHPQKPRFRILCSSKQSVAMKTAEADTRPEHKPGIFDELFLNLFRNKMVQELPQLLGHAGTVWPGPTKGSTDITIYTHQEAGWDSNKPGYEGLIEVANYLMERRTNSETKDAAVRILQSLFPPFLLDLYRMLIAPIQGGKVAAVMIARVTALSCQWLMGPCAVNSVDLPDGSSMMSGVFVERCKYLEESKCIGVCINTCKLPTQTFFNDCMGVPLLMEPKFSDYSCQFKFGVIPPPPKEDGAWKEPCLEICPNASRRRELLSKVDVLQCPKA